MRGFVQSDRPVTLLGGGACAPEELRAALARGPTLVVADGGADRALALGHEPALAVGDFDSISESARARLGARRLVHVADQDSTDFDKALSRIEAPAVLAVGFGGARMDHTLAAFSTLARHRAHRCVLLGGGDLCFLAPPWLEMRLPVGARLSLFPMAPVRGRSEGLHWAIDGLDFAPAGVIGTSNEVAAPEVTLRFEAPAMLVVMADAALDTVLAALEGAPRW